jgi:hypothetical protein
MKGVVLQPEISAFSGADASGCTQDASTVIELSLHPQVRKSQ